MSNRIDSGGRSLIGAIAAPFFVLLAACSSATPRLYDPLVVARRQPRVLNLEAAVPPMCYTRTDGASNPCFVCHTSSEAHDDSELQVEYAFSDFAKTNHWRNLFADRSAEVAAISDEEILAYVREDNYAPLRQALGEARDYPGYVPDLDLALGFDARGFARDGSGWRAIRYWPLPGSFWPTNGSTDDVFVRLPAAMRAQYEACFDVLERAIAGERDLPRFYPGTDIAVVPGVYPEGTEMLHSVRYLDPDAPNRMARRMKELRYARKVQMLDTWATLRAYELEGEEKDEGRLPRYRGSPEVGLRTFLGWQLQGFIEDREGRLRLQTEEEHRQCMGCHSSLGITVDGTFAFPRKVRGAAGYALQDLRGLHDVPEVGHEDGEALTYLRRVSGADELRANGEMLDRFFPGGSLDEDMVRRASSSGPDDLATLFFPSRGRALTLDKAYLVIVRAQSFREGRDATVRPIAQVHERIENETTGLLEAGHVYRDAQLRLNQR